LRPEQVEQVPLDTVPDHVTPELPLLDELELELLDELELELPDDDDDDELPDDDEDEDDELLLEEELLEELELELLLPLGNQWRVRAPRSVHCSHIATR